MRKFVAEACSISARRVDVISFGDHVGAFVLRDMSSIAKRLAPSEQRDATLRFVLGREAERTGAIAGADFGHWASYWAHWSPLQRIHGATVDTNLVAIVLARLELLADEEALVEQLPELGGGTPVRIRRGRDVAVLMPVRSADHGGHPLLLATALPVAPDPAWLTVVGRRSA